MVTNEFGIAISARDAIGFMNEDLREEVLRDISPCTEQELFNEYARRHRLRFNEIWVLDTENPYFMESVEEP